MRPTDEHQHLSMRPTLGSRSTGSSRRDEHILAGLDGDTDLAHHNADWRALARSRLGAGMGAGLALALLGTLVWSGQRRAPAKPQAGIAILAAPAPPVAHELYETMLMPVPAPSVTNMQGAAVLTSGLPTTTMTPPEPLTAAEASIARSMNLHDKVAEPVAARVVIGVPTPVVPINRDAAAQRTAGPPRAPRNLAPQLAPAAPVHMDNDETLLAAMVAHANAASAPPASCAATDRNCAANSQKQR